MPRRYDPTNFTRHTEKVSAKPVPLHGVLESALRRLGLDRDIARYKFVLHWDEIMGADIAKRTRPESLRGGLLRIRVCDSVWAQQLSFYKASIIKRLKKFVAAEEVIEDVMFFVGKVD